MSVMHSATPFYKTGNSGVCYALLHPQLQHVCDKASAILNFQIIVSYRDPVAQMAAFKAGLSKARPGQSAHNYKPALGFDFIVHPFTSWTDIPAFRSAGHVFVAAGHLLGIAVTWGGDWDGDGIETDQSLHDYDHIELTHWKQLRSAR